MFRWMKQKDMYLSKRKKAIIRTIYNSLSYEKE